MTNKQTSRVIAAAIAVFGALAAPAIAQDEGHGVGPEELKAKVKEIDRLMKQAEEALVDSLSAKDKAKATDAAIEKLLEKKAQESMGKSAEQLRKEAEKGSAEAQEAIKKLSKEAAQEASKLTVQEIQKLIDKSASGSGGAGEGIRKLMEETKGQSGEVAKGIQWILDNATTSGGHQGQPKDQKPEEDKPEKKDPTAEKPKDETEPPSTPEGDKWLAQLPPQVRKAYETRNWDAIPPRWRKLLQAWTIKMASELEKNR